MMSGRDRWCWQAKQMDSSWLDKISGNKEIRVMLSWLLGLSMNNLEKMIFANLREEMRPGSFKIDSLKEFFYFLSPYYL